MQRGRAFPFQHHTLGRNARRFFYDCYVYNAGMNPQINTDERRKKRSNRLNEIDLDLSLLPLPFSDFLFVLISVYLCSSVDSDGAFSRRAMTCPAGYFCENFFSSLFACRATLDIMRCTSETSC